MAAVARALQHTPRVRLPVGQLRPDALLTLPDAVKAHVSGALRCRVGDPVRVFNAVDGEFAAVLHTPSSVRVTALLRRPPPPSRCRLLLAAAPTAHASHQRSIEAATECGAAGVIPIAAQRSNQVRLRGDRMQAWMRSSAAQSERFHTPLLAAVAGVHAFCSDFTGSDAMTLRPMDEALEPSEDLVLSTRRLLVILDETDSAARTRFTQALERVARDVSSATLDAVCVMVGPEGGWTPEERRTFQQSATNGALVCSLTSTILRSETAAVVAVGALAVAMGL